MNGYNGGLSLSNIPKKNYVKPTNVYDGGFTTTKVTNPLLNEDKSNKLDSIDFGSGTNGNIKLAEGQFKGALTGRDSTSLSEIGRLNEQSSAREAAQAGLGAQRAAQGGISTGLQNTMRMQDNRANADERAKANAQLSSSILGRGDKAAAQLGVIGQNKVDFEGKKAVFEAGNEVDKANMQEKIDKSNMDAEQFDAKFKETQKLDNANIDLTIEQKNKINMDMAQEKYDNYIASGADLSIPTNEAVAKKLFAEANGLNVSQVDISDLISSQQYAREDNAYAETQKFITATGVEPGTAIGVDSELDKRVSELYKSIYGKSPNEASDSYISFHKKTVDKMSMSMGESERQQDIADFTSAQLDAHGLDNLEPIVAEKGKELTEEQKQQNEEKETVKNLIADRKTEQTLTQDLGYDKITVGNGETGYRDPYGTVHLLDGSTYDKNEDTGMETITHTDGTSTVMQGGITTNVNTDGTFTATGKTDSGADFTYSDENKTLKIGGRTAVLKSDSNGNLFIKGRKGGAITTGEAYNTAVKLGLIKPVVESETEGYTFDPEKINTKLTTSDKGNGGYAISFGDNKYGSLFPNDNRITFRSGDKDGENSTIYIGTNGTLRIKGEDGELSAYKGHESTKAINMINSAIEAGMLIKNSDGTYKWAHETNKDEEAKDE